SFEGIIYDTASISTMHAIAAARERLGIGIREEGLSGRSVPLLRVYASEHAHSSIEKALITLGHGQRSLCFIPADDQFRMDPRLLAAAIEEDKSKGVLPCCVVATVGTTSMASIDPVKEIASICGKHNVWLHIDAAYGGSAAVVPELRYVLDACEQADSLVINPHKWLFVPIDLSVLFSRHMSVLKQAFSLVPEYLKTDEASTVINQMDYGIQLGRRFRALKLWMVLRYFGQEGLATRIREHCRLAQIFASFIEEDPSWELLAPVHFSLVCFRAAPQISAQMNAQRDEEHEELLNRLNERIMNEVNASGKTFLSHTRLKGRFVLRLAIGNIRTEERHVRQVWSLLQESFEKNR
ncbi:MAG: pyridoxal phosphate-dependent decarboxylase family protein, partial [Pyrinomonadaceae bacterium]